MALIKCPECKHKVSDRALSCPSCGLPLTPSAEPAQEVSAAAEPVEQIQPPAVFESEPVAVEPSPPSYSFAQIYACLCFVGCFFAVYFGVVATVHIARTGDWLNNTSTQRSSGLLVAVILMFALWLATGVSILRRKRRAIWLSYCGAVVAGIGILARGIIPLDIILAIPTFAIIPYLRKRSETLTP